MNNIWLYFDGVFCINLKHRPDKWEKALIEFSKVGLEDIVQRIDGVIHEKDNALGCKQAHLNAVLMAKEKNYKRVLIFEDDVEFKVTDLKIIEKVINQLKKITDWRMFYFGSIPGMHLGNPVYGDVKSIADENLLEVSGFYGGHAYALSAEVYDEVLDNFELHKEIDKYYVKTIAKKYKTLHAYPLICRQAAGFSDIREVKVNRHDSTEYLEERRNVILQAENSFVDIQEDFERIEGTIISSFRYAQNINFFVCSKNDYIQKYNFNGFFYEEEELFMISKHVKENARILDIGANIGNHALFFAKILKAQEVIVVEPNLAACNILKTNILVNGIENINTSYLRMALGKKRVVVNVKNQIMNLGTSSVVEDKNGDTLMVPGDEVFSQEKFDFIKIDTSNTELDVLEGLKTTLKRNNAVVFVNIINAKFKQFEDFLKENGYKVIDQYTRYSNSTNYLIEKV